jgi:hypothetical protein
MSGPGTRTGFAALSTGMNDVLTAPVGEVEPVNDIQCWRVHNRLHRDGAPALVVSDGTQMWFQNGRLHRVGGPALIHPDGSYGYYFRGRLHRLDGPAVLNSDGSQEWWHHGRLELFVSAEEAAR